MLIKCTKIRESKQQRERDSKRETKISNGAGQTCPSIGGSRGGGRRLSWAFKLATARAKCRQLHVLSAKWTDS